MKRNLGIGLAFIVVISALGIGSAVLEKKATVEAAGVQAPRFEVDPMWPKPLPNHWVMGNTIGVSVDAGITSGSFIAPARSKRWRPTRPTNRAECCKPAPPVLEFDEEGNLLDSWGGEDGPGYDWPASNHGITVDYKGNVWIGGNGRTANAPATAEVRGQRGSRGRRCETSRKPRLAAAALRCYHDSMVLKFTQDGKFLMPIGKPGASKGSNDVENLGLPAKIFVDPKTNELYVADGYGNKRVIVFDADTGKYKRHWGAYGNKPDDTNLGPYNPDAPPAQQFRNPVHCAELSNDGLLYVCDRVNDRIQVFKPDGTFVKEIFIAKNTLGDGSVWDIAFSKDPQQKYMYLADGANEKDLHHAARYARRS